MSKKGRDQKLGMGCSITRRDFLNGFAMAVGASMLPLGEILAQEKGADASAMEALLAQGITQQDPRYYPPALTGLRGSHAGSFEVAHSLRDGKEWPDAAEDKESYDLIVVGGGISGLSAAYFYRKFAGANSRILVLDNHDDFGGHAKRNEFRAGDRLLLGYGGTQSIEAPGRYSKEAGGLLKDLGIDVQRFYKYYDRKLYESKHLKSGTFFDKETFGEDRLVPGPAEGYDPNNYVSAKMAAQMPIAEVARKDIIRLQNEAIDYMPDLDPEQKRAKLIKTSYKDFLLQYAKVNPDVAKVFQTFPHDLFCVGIDAVSAENCRGMGYPGFKGMKVASGRRRREGGEEEPYIFHFPDGNASVARLLVRALVPGSAPGSTMEDIVTAKMNYARIDDPASPVRIRLNSTAVRVKHVGDLSNAKEVEVTYVLAGKGHKVHAATCVLACYNVIVPYLCPEMPEKQKDALAYAVKQPLVYTNVQIRNWKAFEKLGVSDIYAPGGYFSSVVLDFPVSLGDYHFPSSPEEPCLLHLTRTPCKPGLPCKEQFKAGRYELLMTAFETFERKIRDQLGRMLAGGGFDPARDIQAITVNRWPHGYAYEYNQLFEPVDRPESERPCVIGRQPFGRITIANSDSDGHAYTNIAIDQGYRAVNEVMSIIGRTSKTSSAMLF
jgi:spermidine dehydrogenase